VDASNLRYQYDDSAKLRIRAETHRLYSAQPDQLRTEILEHLALSPGDDCPGGGGIPRSEPIRGTISNPVDTTGCFVATVAG
jgi:hypothetical protein